MGRIPGSKTMLFLIRVAVVAALLAIFYVRTDGFSPSHIQSPLVEKASESPTTPVLQVLSQPYHYLAKGRQSFVFESEDGSTVIKFFNRKYIAEPWYTEFLPEKLRQKEKAKRERRKYFYSQSYDLAWKKLGEGILYLHMGATEGLPTVTLVDKGGRKFSIDLNRIPFVLQKKGILLYSYLNSAYLREGREGLENGIKTFVGEVSKRIALQIGDGDQDVKNNWGFVDGHVFHLDPGRLYFDENLADRALQRSEWNSATRNFRKWLLKNYPESVSFLDQKIEEAQNDTKQINHD
jgi:hypothetical protein